MRAMAPNALGRRVERNADMLKVLVVGEGKIKAKSGNSSCEQSSSVQ